jgi:hypothetical protein
MATPHVSGVAALVWSNHDCSASEIRNALACSAEDLGSTGRDDTFGYGLVNAQYAHELLDIGCTYSFTSCGDGFVPVGVEVECAQIYRLAPAALLTVSAVRTNAKVRREGRLASSFSSSSRSLCLILCIPSIDN